MLDTDIYSHRIFFGLALQNCKIFYTIKVHMLMKSGNIDFMLNMKKNIKNLLLPGA